ncbi:MAG: 4-hydroxybenzoate octaprenyltransferase [Thermoleophilia bacterium]|nr:4-hydroxybenzoate octaprenyltransferase [Thermoleophilia bacterium]
MGTLRRLSSLVKLEHTVFALPYAYAGMVLGAAAAHTHVTVARVVWITIAMVGARTLAMGLNRLIDVAIDARNPRTQSRELVTGVVRRAQVVAMCVVAAALLVLATTQLAAVTRALWPIPVALFVLYPYTKRFTWACHLVLGLSIGLAPLGAWLAVGGPAGDTAPYLLWLGVASWIGGFDIIYALDDIDFDRSAGLSSIPARFGVAPALFVTHVCHAATIALFAAVGVLSHLNLWFWAGWAIATALLVWENVIVRPDDLSRIDRAFFTANSYVGVALGAGLVLGSALH